MLKKNVNMMFFGFKCWQEEIASTAVHLSYPSHCDFFFRQVFIVSPLLLMLSYLLEIQWRHKPLLICFETGSHYVAKADLKFSVLLPQPPECWDNRCVPPHSAKTWFLNEILSTVNYCHFRLQKVHRQLWKERYHNKHWEREVCKNQTTQRAECLIIPQREKGFQILKTE
jgi:hypothetical protein